MTSFFDVLNVLGLFIFYATVVLLAFAANFMLGVFVLFVIYAICSPSK